MEGALEIGVISFDEVGLLPYRTCLPNQVFHLIRPRFRSLQHHLAFSGISFSLLLEACKIQPYHASAFPAVKTQFHGSPTRIRTNIYTYKNHNVL